MHSSFLFGQEIDEYLIKSAFLFKVPVFIDWPANANYLAPQNTFDIAIIGNDPFKGKLESIIKSRNIKIKNKAVSVRYISKIEEIKNADILFISNSEKSNLSKILTSVKDKPILTVSDNESFLEKGVMLNMFIADGSLEFNINMKPAGEAKIYISSKLLVNAIKVIK